MLRRILTSNLLSLLAITVIVGFCIYDADARVTSRVKTWVDGNTLTATDLNAEFDNILTTLTGYVGADNIMSGINLTLGNVTAATVTTTGAGKFTGEVGITGVLNCYSTLAVLSSMTAQSGTFTGAVSAASALISGALSCTGATVTSLHNSGRLTQVGAADFNGAVRMDSTLGVTGAVDLSSTLAVTGAQTLTGLTNANGGIAVDTDKFTVAGDGTGNTVVAGTLNVTGAQTFTGATAANGGITVDSTNFTVDGTSGAVGTASTVTAGGVAALNGGITVDTSNFTVSGSTGAVTSASTITSTGRIGTASTLTVGSATDLADAYSFQAFVNGALGAGGSATVLGTGYNNALVLDGTLAGGIAAIYAETQNSTATTDLKIGSSAENVGLYWDTSAVSLGVNDDSPSYGLDVNGTGRYTGALTLDSTLSVTGEASLNGGITVDSTNFTVDGTSGAVSTASTLGVTGSSSLDGGITVDTSNFTVSGSTGAVTSASTITSTGRIGTASTLTVGSATDLADAYSFQAYINGALGAGGSCTVLGTGYNNALVLDGTLVSGIAAIYAETQDGTSTTDLKLGSSAANVGLYWDTSAVSLGVNDDSPSYNLDVNGTFRARGASIFDSSLAINGGLTMDTDKFTVADATGNVRTAGTLGVSGEVTFSNANNFYGGSTRFRAGSELRLVDDVNLQLGSTAGSSFYLRKSTSGVLELRYDNGSTYPHVFVANSSGNLTLSATNLAGTTSKLYVDSNGTPAYAVSVNADVDDIGISIDLESGTGIGATVYPWVSRGRNTGGAAYRCTGALATQTGTSSGGIGGRLELQTANQSGATLTTAFIINDSQNVSLASTDLAGTAWKQFNYQDLPSKAALAWGKSATLPYGVLTCDYAEGGKQGGWIYTFGEENPANYFGMGVQGRSTSGITGILRHSGTFEVQNASQLTHMRIDANGEVYFPELGTTTATAANAVLEGSPLQLKIVSSLRKLKTDIKTIDTDWNKFMSLNPVSFLEKAKKNGPRIFGFIAEEIEKIYKPLAVYDADGKLQSVAYDRITAINTAAIQDLKRENDELKDRVARLEKMVEKMAKAKK